MNISPKVVILGGKGTAINVAEAIIDSKERYGIDIDFIGFAFDDDNFGDTIAGYPVVTGTKHVYEKYKHYNDVFFIFQMYRQDKMLERAELIKTYCIPDNRWFTFVHPSCFVSKSVKLGHGSVVYANCAIHSNVTTGAHCTFSALTTIGHDTQIGNNVFTATHVCIGSSVEVGDCVFLGQNSTVIGSIKVAENNLIGLGATVVKDIKESNKVYFGSPAKAFKNIIG